MNKFEICLLKNAKKYKNKKIVAANKKNKQQSEK